MEEGTMRVTVIATGLDDDRVRAVGMYLEGLDDIEGFSRAATRALEKGVPIVVLKVGRTEPSQSSSRIRR